MTHALQDYFGNLEQPSLVISSGTELIIDTINSDIQRPLPPSRKEITP